MKLPGKLIVPLLAVLFLAGGGFIWGEYRKAAELESEAAAANRGAARRADEEATRPAGPVGVAPNAGAAEPAKTVQNPRTAKPIAADPMKEWLAAANDPEVLRRLTAQARDLTLQRYANFFSQRQLTAEQTATLTKLLNDKRQVAMDLAVADFKSGIDPREDLNAFEAQVAAAKDSIEKEIRSFLGEDGYARYENYGRDQGVINTFVHLQTLVDGTENALSAEQTARLQAILESGSSGLLSPPKIAAAREFLSPAQMEAVQQVYADQRALGHERNLQALPPPVGGK